MMIRYGLCCISNQCQSDGHKFQTMTFKRFSVLPHAEALSILIERYANNLRTMSAILDQCIENGWTYRASSSLFPLMTHPDAAILYDDLPNRDVLDDLFAEIREKIATNMVRVSCHPDQYNVLASPNDKSVESTIRELNYHGWFMDMIGAPRNHDAPINIHINRSTGSEPIEIAERFKTNFARLDESVRTRLVVENEDKGIWTAQNLIDVFHPTVGIPITFDNLHHECNPGDWSAEEAFRACYLSWSTKPLFHYSESLPDQSNPRKHAEFPVGQPESYGLYVDFDIELKGKDTAILMLPLLEEVETSS